MIPTGLIAPFTGSLVCRRIINGRLKARHVYIYACKSRSTAQKFVISHFTRANISDSLLMVVRGWYRGFSLVWQGFLWIVVSENVGQKLLQYSKTLKKVAHDYISFDGYCRWKLSNLYTFIRPNQEQKRRMQLQVPACRNWTCGPAIPVQHSNQLSYRGHQLSSSTKFMYTRSTALYRLWVNIKIWYE